MDITSLAILVFILFVGLYTLSHSWVWAVMTWLSGIYFTFTCLAHVIDFQIWTGILYLVAGMFVSFCCAVMFTVLDEKGR